MGGELNGTNHGRMFVKLQHEDNRVYGEGNFNESALGSYKYHVQGVVTGEDIDFMLTPVAISNTGLNLGNVEANGKLDKSGKITGNWLSSIGTKGTFFVSRASLHVKKESKKQDKNSKSVFIVHGHDDATKEKVARFVEKTGLVAIILHEQVNKDMTIIEKFEESSKNVNFAVVLFTPDDIAYPLGDKETLKPRARQNVVLEMGYFVGSLGRDRVYVLYKGDVELPSDILGVVYTKIDDRDSWKLSLAQELKSAGYSVDLNKLIT
jgi:predicted nucleotide-binding protein